MDKGTVVHYFLLGSQRLTFVCVCVLFFKLVSHDCTNRGWVKTIDTRYYESAQLYPEWDTAVCILSEALRSVSSIGHCSLDPWSVS